MATVAQLQQQLASLRLNLQEYEAQIASLREEIDNARNQTQISNLTRQLTAKEQGLRDIQNNITLVQREIVQTDQTDPAPAPSQTSGQVVQSQQQDSPLATEPPPSLIPPGVSGVSYDDEGNIISTFDQDGNASPDDDAGEQQSTEYEYDPEPQTTVKQNADGIEYQSSTNNYWITPEPNILDQYPSYSYVISVYMLSADQYNFWEQNARNVNLNGYNLLFQSGGAPANSGGFRGAAGATAESLGQGNTSSDAGRNPAFPYDYYIESLSIKTVTMSGIANGGVDVDFTVVEPYGITLLDNVYLAAQDLNNNTNTNWKSPAFLIAIRFYGYDTNGKIIAPLGANPRSSDPNSIVEKYYTFLVKQVKFRVKDGVTRYDWSGAITGQVGTSTMRGSIPQDIQLTGQTVRDLLEGDPVGSTTNASEANPGASTTSSAGQTDPGPAPSGRTGADTADPGYIPPPTASAPASQTKAPPNAPAAKNKSYIRTGLMQAMNELQENLRVQAKFDYRDTYTIEWAENANAIRDAIITVPSETTNKSQTASAPPVSKNTQSGSPTKGAMNPTTRVRSFAAGTMLLQAIEQIISTSDYIRNQANIVFDESSNEAKPNPNNRNTDFTWFNVLMTVTQGKYDKARRDYVYNIKYTITTYQPRALISPYFEPPRFRGVHKSYPYWFTGQNTAVLSYEANFDHNFTVTVTGGGDLVKQNLLSTANSRELFRAQTQARTPYGSQGAEGRANDIPASAKEYLYSANSNATAKVTIIGDPAWLQQGVATGRLDPAALSLKPFLSDGTINFDTGGAMFEIVWQKPQDYDLNTGLADPYLRNGKLIGADREPIQKVAYLMTTIQSNFRNGKFTHDIEGSILLSELPQSKVTKPRATASQDDANDQDNGSGNQTGQQNDRELARTATIATSTSTAAKAPPSGVALNQQTDPAPGPESVPNTTTQTSPPPQPAVSNGTVTQTPFDNEISGILNFLRGPPKANTNDQTDPAPPQQISRET